MYIHLVVKTTLSPERVRDRDREIERQRETDTERGRWSKVSEPYYPRADI